MIRIKISINANNFPVVRQTSNSRGIYNNCQFFVNDDSLVEFDYWVVYDSLIETKKTLCPKDNVILITAEPPSIRNYSKIYTKQFSKIITCHKNIVHSNTVNTQQGLPWMAGVRFDIQKKEWDTQNYKDVNQLEKPIQIEKTNKLCIITSKKTFTNGHKKRLDFVLKLKDRLNDFVDVYGNGFEPVEDKLDILSKYRYALVIENSSYEDYWTEKLSDAFLAECYPIYYGCPNICSYFHKDSISIIDINDFEKSCENINKTLSDIGFYTRQKESIIQSKKKVLYEYNLFNLITSNIDLANRNLPKSPITLKPLKNSLQQKVIFKIKKLLSNYMIWK